MMEKLLMMLGMATVLIGATGVSEARGIKATTTAMEGVPVQAGTSGLQQRTSNSEPKTTRVMVTGDAIVQAQPDTAIITLSVVTQNKLAIVAQRDNASRTEAVINALKSATGAGAEIKTSGYSLQPQRLYKEGQPPTITGYEARNTVILTLGDLTRVGVVIDAASQAGANDIAGIAFTLRQDQTARNQALKAATREAVSKAEVIAQALGGRLTQITEVQEQGFQRPQPILQNESLMMRSAAPTTPVQVGSLDISSRVQLIAEIAIG